MLLSILKDSLELDQVRYDGVPKCVGADAIEIELVDDRRVSEHGLPRKERPQVVVDSDDALLLGLDVRLDRVESEIGVCRVPYIIIVIVVFIYDVERLVGLQVELGRISPRGQDFRILHRGVRKRAERSLVHEIYFRKIEKNVYVFF